LSNFAARATVLCMKLDGATLSVTGIGGFIGRRLAERAIARGMRVRGLDQSDQATRDLPGVDVVVGDVCDAAAARAACAGADVVVHTAAVVREDGPRDLYQRINVGGTEQMVAAAREAGVRRFVQVSSVMVYGFRYPPMVAEDGPLRGEGNPYCETKIESERVALAKHEPGRFEVTVIRPGDVYGPRSVPWVVRPYSLMKAGLFVLPSGGKGMLNPVYVDDLVDAVLLSIERDASGAFTVTDGAASTCMDYFRPIAEAAGSRSIRTAPAGLLRVVFGAVQTGARAVGRESPAAPSAVDYLMRPHAYSIEKAKRELGYRPSVSLPEGMRRVREWLAREPPVTAK
jgi:nucleoside-diphosphate-sugar epimerase